MTYTFPSMLVTTTSIHLHAVFPVLPGCAVRQGRAQNASQSAEKCRYSLAYPIWPFATWQWYLEKTALLCSWFLRWYLRNRWFNPHRGKIWHNREEGGGRNEAGKFQRYEIQLPEEENEAGRISGGHGGDHPVGGMGGNHQALVSLWETRTAAHRDRNYAADVSAAMLVQPVGRGRRGGHLRQQRQPMSMTSPQRQNCCERTMRPSMGTVHIWDWKNGMKSSMTHSFPPSNTGSTAARPGIPAPFRPE